MEQQLIRHESLKLEPYKDSKGILTIGVGRNLEERGITEEEAMYLLRNDIKIAWRECLQHVPHFRKMSTTRQMAMVDMMFNLGLPRFLGFKKMLRALERQDYVWAAEEMLDSKWRHDVGKRAIRLARMMRHGRGEW